MKAIQKNAFNFFDQQSNVYYINFKESEFADTVDTENFALSAIMDS